MKKKIFSISLLLCLLTHTPIIRAQSIISIQILGGISFPAGNFGQQVPLTDTVRAIWPYQMKMAYSIGARGILALKKNHKLNLTLGLNYSAFSNKQEVINIYATSSGGTAWQDRAGEGGTATITFHPKVNIITLSAGLDYKFKPKAKLDPFADIELTVNYFTGNFSFDQISNGIYSTADLSSTTRVGFQLTGGLQYDINDNFGLIGGLRVDFTNLLGKTSASQDIHTQNIELSDKGITASGSTSSALNIAYVGLFLGVNLYLNSPENPPGK